MMESVYSELHALHWQKPVQQILVSGYSNLQRYLAGSPGQLPYNWNSFTSDFITFIVIVR
jgi:hypothetical protein